VTAGTTAEGYFESCDDDLLCGSIAAGVASANWLIRVRSPLPLLPSVFFFVVVVGRARKMRQVFCCIAIVGAAVVYFCILWARQLFWGIRADRIASPLPAPPRSLASNGALPVYGHTFLFQKWAGSAALLFDSNDTEYGKLKLPFCSRKLGECFAIYIWGQWRVCIQGPERTRKVLDYDVEDAFPWTPPVTLLGKSCLSFLEHRDAEQLREILQRPLGQKTIIQYASAFAELAEKCLDDTMAGKFTRKIKKPKGGKSGDSVDVSQSVGVDFAAVDDEDEDVNQDEESGGAGYDDADSFHKLKWEALRSYSFDLIDGPILAMNKWMQPSAQSHGESTAQNESSRNDSRESANATGSGVASAESKKRTSDELPRRETMLLWMERLKAGVDTIKLTFGPEWMYIWILNEYGRALNARMHISPIFSKHVATMSEKVPVEHRPGHSYHDPVRIRLIVLTRRGSFVVSRIVCTSTCPS